MEPTERGIPAHDPIQLEWFGLKTVLSPMVAGKRRSLHVVQRQPLSTAGKNPFGPVRAPPNQRDQTHKILVTVVGTVA